MSIFVDTNEDGYVVGFSDVRISANGIEVEISEDHIFFTDNWFSYKVQDGELVKDLEHELEAFKKNKMKKLSRACNEWILGRFPCEVNGETYYFSNDNEAQANFEKCDRAFEKGRITEMNWTAYAADERVVRLSLNADSFELLYIAHLNHVQTGIAKLRDELMIQVDAATTPEEVLAIEW